ncbi:MAG: 2-alkenal reductase [Chthoniobacteraceae bacterium]|nr:2-alkenal reductase [Chthoniobacteraceae bacterium]
MMPRFFHPRFPCFAALILLSSLHAGAAETDKAALGLLRQIDEGFVAVFEKVAPAVVIVESRKKAAAEDEEEDARSFDFFFKDGETPEKNKDESRRRYLPMPKAPVRSEGSGFIMRPDGFILTNQHVVADAEKLTVRLRDGRILPAKLIGVDDKTDIAVIKIEAKDLPIVEFGDSEKLRVGQLVCAIGTPFNQDYSFTCGWVSGKGRSNLLSGTSNTVLYEDYIQTDAFINPGNSGGPLFDVGGAVIGMNTLINGIGRGLAFAIPSNMLADVGAQLIATGHVRRSWLGIRMETLSENSELRERVNVDRGIVVRTIEANAPAYHSDLRPADIIIELDSVKLSSAHDLQKEVLKKKIGQLVQLTVWRAGATLKIPVTTGELPGEFSKVSTPASKKEAKLENWGLKLRDHPKNGAVVTEILPQSSASKVDIQVDDVITEVESKPVRNAEGVLAAISAADSKEKKGVLLNIERKGKRTFAVLEKAK